MFLTTLAHAAILAQSSDFKLPIDQAEVEHLISANDSMGVPVGEAYLNVVRPGSPRATVPESDKAEALHWISRLFRREYQPAPNTFKWEGSSLTTPMGLFENVHAAFRLDDRKVVWADGFSKEDPSGANPVWMWTELRRDEIDCSTEDSVHKSVAKFVRTYFNLYNEQEPISVRTYYDGSKDAFGYWGLALSQDVPSGLPSVCGWMKQFGVMTNGKQLFITIMYCMDASFEWRPKKDQLFFGGNAAFRTRSRFTGEPMRYSPKLTSPPRDGG